MAPSENFAQKRLEAESLIRQHAPGHLQEQLIALLCPVIALTATRVEAPDISVGASKFGGAPDVPEGFEWPTWNGQPLGFLAQINLEEVASLDAGGLLPKSGMLWFFVCLVEDNRVGGQPEQFQGWRVLFGHGPLHRVTPPANSHWISPINSQRVYAGAGWSLDGDSLDSFDWEEEDEGWCEFQSEVLEVPPHRMLASPYAPQLSPFISAANGSQGRSVYDLYEDRVSTEGWELLLQLDTRQEGFFEGIHDLGWLYFMIQRDDLEKGNFSRVWHNTQST